MKKLATIAVGLISPLFYISPVFAQIGICPKDPGQQSGFAPLCSLVIGDFGTLIGRLVQLILIVAIVISLFYLIYGGVKWVISGGDKTAVESARNHIVAAIVGLVIALLAFFILNIIAGLFGIQITNIELPKLNPH